MVGEVSRQGKAVAAFHRVAFSSRKVALVLVIVL